LVHPGLQKLLEKSIPEATHDSSARDPPPMCHPGTRVNYINSLTKWGRNPDDHPNERITWVKGPAGVGKSAIAQSSADALGGDLGASFFFSRYNRREDPKRFFTTIAYELAVRLKLSRYGILLDEAICDDNTIIEKALHVQFEELIVKPIRKLEQQGEIFSTKVILVDGLDECEGSAAQESIVQIIAASLRKKTTPFLWIFFSRLEPHLISTFNRFGIAPLISHTELTISRKLDREIFFFLAEKLAEIRRKHALEESWPTEGDLHDVVDLSSGLWAYSHALTLFIDDPDSLGPKDQLRIVLSLARKIKQSGGTRHPLAALDLFYSELVLKRLPPKKLHASRTMLLATRLGVFGNHRSIPELVLVANFLGYSKDQLRNLCQSLHSVVSYDEETISLEFYHASFMDFLGDPARSNDLCIWSEFNIVTLFDRALQSLSQVSVIPSEGSSHRRISIPQQLWDAYVDKFDDFEYRFEISPGTHVLYWKVFDSLVRAFFKLAALASIDDIARRRHLLQIFDYRVTALPQNEYYGDNYDKPRLWYKVLERREMQSLCVKLSKLGLLRPLKNPSIPGRLREFLFGQRDECFWTLGDGVKRIVLVTGKNGYDGYIMPRSMRHLKQFTGQNPVHLLESY
ncbi:hypothetical protein AN958_01772, partial [Leucoagaricus sp. SymC.cos]